VFTPPNSNNSAYPGDQGFNFSGVCDGSCGGLYSGAHYSMAVIFPGNPTMTAYTSAFSHELVEALTSNVYLTNCGSARQQIVDVCNFSKTTPQTEVSVVTYWSGAKNTCVIPDAWATVYEYNGTPGSWTVIGDNVRQVAQGESGLFATFLDDSINLYT